MCSVLALVLCLAATTAADTVTFHLEPVDRRIRPASSFDERQLEVLQKLNRVDTTHLARLTQLVVPDRWVADDLAYSPLPREYVPAGGAAKLIVVHQPMQVFGAYEAGRLVRWGPVSSGRRSRQTPSGVFHLNWRSPGRHSTVDPEWFMRWYFNFDNAEGLSFHEYGLPGLPASHACVRLLAADARWLYDWGEEWRLDATGRQIVATGTPVVIIGTYSFDSPPPWRAPHTRAGTIELPDLEGLAR